MKLFGVLCIWVITWFSLTSTANAQSAFQKVTFANGVTVELPKTWTYLDKQLRDHINTAGEAVGKRIGLPTAQGDNIILVAGNAYLKEAKRPVATVRLSIRKDSTMSQAEMLEISRMPASEVMPLFSAVATNIGKSILQVDGVSSYKNQPTKIVRASGTLCFLTASKVVLHGRAQTWNSYLCPTGIWSVKLTTTHDVQHAELFRPVIEYIQRSFSPM